VLALATLPLLATAQDEDSTTAPFAQATSDEAADAVEPQLEPEPFEGSEVDHEVRIADDIEEITITGTQSEAMTDFSQSDSVTGFDASDLEAMGTQDIKDLAAFTPNLEIVTAGSTTPTFFIRGVGLNDFGANSTSAVAIYQDDVPLNSQALQLGMVFDLEGINILRGPQGTGPARNATAGAIKLYSKKPTGDFGGYLRGTYGKYNFVDFEGAVEMPVYSDIVSLRIAGRFYQRDGYATNGCGGLPSYEQRKADGLFRPDNLDGIGLPDDPTWSACGENVKKKWSPIERLANPDLVDGVGAVPADLPTEVNDLGRWAARATFLFEPTLDQRWLLGGHGGRLDQLTTLGQSIGVNETLLFTDGTIVEGVLGGRDGGRYSPREIQDARNARIAELTALCTAANNCTGDEENDAKLQVAQELADNLDARPWHVDVNRVGQTTNDTWGAFLKGDIVLPKNMNLRTVTGYDAYSRFIDIDLDFSPNELFEIVTDDEGWQFTQDLNLEGEFDNFTWEVGGFYLQETLNVTIDNFFGDRQTFGVAARAYEQRLYSAAGYASLAWDFTESFTLDGGFRYNWERKEIDYELDRNNVIFPDNQQRTWDAPTGMVRLTYRVRDDTHLYWKYTRGWKGGHFNATSSLIDGVTSAEPENIDSFEGGVRGSWFDARVGLNASFFYYNYEDYQIFTIKNDDSTATPEFVVLNANAAETYGAEVDLVLNPWEGAFANVRFGWLESQFLDFVQFQTQRRQIGAGFATILKEIQNTGNPLLNSPRFKISFTVEQALTLGRWGTLTPRYDGAWTDEAFYDPTAGRGIPNKQAELFLPPNTIGQRAFWNHNVRLAYRTPDGTIELAGYVRNASNIAVKTFGFDASSFQRTTIYFVGIPRTWGVELSYTF